MFENLISEGSIYLLVISFNLHFGYVELNNNTSSQLTFKDFLSTVAITFWVLLLVIYYLKIFESIKLKMQKRQDCFELNALQWWPQFKFIVHLSQI